MHISQFKISCAESLAISLRRQGIEPKQIRNIIRVQYGLNFHHWKVIKEKTQKIR